MKNESRHVKLQLLPLSSYKGIDQGDPIRFYFWPVLGSLYRRRVELCLNECSGGERILEVGFGSGLTFLNLSECYKNIHGIDVNPLVGDVSKAFTSRAFKTHLLRASVLEIPYSDNSFDSVLLISILEHLKPMELNHAFTEIKRVLRPGGQVVYGVPVERPFMVVMFRLLGCNIREHHFSTQKDVYLAARKIFEEVRVKQMQSIHRLLGPVYEVGHFRKGL